LFKEFNSMQNSGCHCNQKTELKISSFKQSGHEGPYIVHLTMKAQSHFLGLCDLVFDPRWLIFKLDLEIIKTTFLTNFQAIRTEVLTRFSIFWLCDLIVFTKNDQYSKLHYKSSTQSSWPISMIFGLRQ
jgi:hypothetical protein